jgi:FG-GAP-like repeat
MKILLIFLLFINISIAQKPNFEPQTIDSQINIGYGIAIGDVDGDKKPDILLADQKQFVWYRNGDWKRFVMAENLTERDNVCIAARDIDGDGKVEVAVGANWNPGETNDLSKSGSVHYLIAPKDRTQKWEAVELHHEVTIHRMKWIKVDKKRFQLIVVPLHGLGNKNGEGKGVKIWAYEVPKNVKMEWKRALVDSSLHMTHNFEI